MPTALYNLLSWIDYLEPTIMALVGAVLFGMVLGWVVVNNLKD